VVGELRRDCVCFISLFMVMACCVFHFSDGISWIPRYIGFVLVWDQYGLNSIFYIMGLNDCCRHGFVIGASRDGTFGYT
jgi:hypothetical protein